MSVSNKSEIWFFNQYASTPEYGIPGRHYYFGRELSKLNFKIKIFAANNSHLNIKEKETRNSRVIINSNFSIFFLSTFKYRSSKSPWRVINWFIYSLHCLLLPFRIKSKPDYIIYSSPSLLGVVSAYVLAKYYDAKLVFDVRDIWPLTLIELGGFSNRNPLIRSMSIIEKFAYKKSDQIISNVPLFKLYIEDLINLQDKVRIIPNGIDLEEFVPSSTFNIDNLSNILKGKFVVGYVGTIGTANALDTLVTAAGKIQNKDVHFLIVGNGSELASIKKSSENLSNITFLNAVQKNQVPSILELIDVGYLAQLPKEMYKYGLASIKIPEYLIMGKPVIHMTNFWSPVAGKDFGSVIRFGDTAAFIDAISKYNDLKNDKTKTFCEDAHLFAINNYDYKKISEKLISTLNNI